jgi:pimeloyl-ACP methyl ester carboxylesterase
MNDKKPFEWNDKWVEHRYAEVNGVRLHYVEAGPPGGPLLVLLHGWPEFWYCWRHQIPALSRAGFRVIAPDLRGFGLSAKPERVASYRMSEVSADVVALIASLGGRAAALVGHDWGGVVAWHTAMKHPEVMEKLVILNCPHPRRFLAALRSARQIRKSWYMFFFQLPVVAERGIARKDFAVIRRAFRTQPVRPLAYTDADIDRIVEALKQPGALTGGLNYYRAAFRRPPIERSRGGFRPVPCRVLVIWGDRDVALGRELAEPDPKWVPNARVEHLDASHWVPSDAPERVNALITDFVGVVRPAA